MHLRSLARLSPAFLALLGDPTVRYVGKGVKGDLEKLGADFQCSDVTNRIIQSGRCIDLAQLAVTRGVVEKASCGLQRLVLETLHQDLKKDDSVRSSDWNKKQISEQQLIYAALDAIKSLQVYIHLMQLTDITARLRAREANPNVLVDIVPQHGKVAPGTLSTKAGQGKILATEPWEPPTGIKRKSNRKPPTRLVLISQVLAPNLVIPGYRSATAAAGGNSSHRPSTLGDFASSGLPFKIELPLHMLVKKQPNHLADIAPFAPVPPSPQRHNTATTGGNQAHWEVPNETDLINLDDPQLPDHDSMRCEMTAEDIAVMNDILLIAESRKLVVEGNDVLLPPPPVRIVDQFKAVLGDNFHYQHRIVVPVKHEMKKAFYVAQMEAFFAWDPDILEKAKHRLRNQEHMSDTEIASMMYYDAEYFKKCVPRRVLPPSMLYWRVRAVYATYGPIKDTTTGKPLFNDGAWKKARRVLEEILAGHVSDPPGESFYTQRVDCYGEPITNRHGLPVYSCERGTNSTENYHKQLLASIGTWSSGTEIADPLRDEHRHRYNQSISERKRFGYPRIGHADTWLIDLLQVLVEDNHDVLLYPFWSNTSDFLDTDEAFGTVPLQSADLTQAVNQLEIETRSLSPEQRYLAHRQGVKVCFTPVVFVAERVIFNDYVLLHAAPIDFEAMALEWVTRVNGKNIFPKLAVYLRTYYDEWRRKQRIKEAVRQAATKKDALRQLNSRLMPSQPLNRGTSATTTLDTPAPQDDEGATVTNGMTDSISLNMEDGSPRADAEAANFWPTPASPPTMPQPPLVPIMPPVLGVPVRIVGGTRIVPRLSGGVSSTQAAVAPRTRGDRDQRPRQPRSCKRCVRLGGTIYSRLCTGRTNKGRFHCQYFTPDGMPTQMHDGGSNSL